MLSQQVLNNPKKLTIYWLGYWIGIVGLITVCLKLLGFSYDENYIIYSIHFISMTVLGIIVFNAENDLKRRLQGSQYIKLYFFPLLIFLFLTLYIQYIYPLSKEQAIFLKELGLGFPNFTLTTFITKTSDIIYQQTMILILVLAFERQNIPKKKIVKKFSIIFFVLHLPLLLVFGWHGLMFIIPCLVAGGIFSYLILYYKQGHFYSIMVHQLFYILLGFSLRFIDLS